MSQEHNMRRVTAIRNGTVIDHIPSGQAMRVLEMLNIGKATSVPVSMVMNVPSKKMGTKDIIKVPQGQRKEGEEEDENDAHREENVIAQFSYCKAMAWTFIGI